MKNYPFNPTITLHDMELIDSKDNLELNSFYELFDALVNHSDFHLMAQSGDSILGLYLYMKRKLHGKKNDSQ